MDKHQQYVLTNNKIFLSLFSLLQNQNDNICSLHQMTYTQKLLTILLEIISASFLKIRQTELIVMTTNDLTEGEYSRPQGLITEKVLLEHTACNTQRIQTIHQYIHQNRKIKSERAYQKQSTLREIGTSYPLTLQLTRVVIRK